MHGLRRKLRRRHAGPESDALGAKAACTDAARLPAAIFVAPVAEVGDTAARAVGAVDAGAIPERRIGHVAAGPARMGRILLAIVAAGMHAVLLLRFRQRGGRGDRDNRRSR